MKRTEMIRLLLDSAKAEIENMEIIYSSNATAKGIVEMEDIFSEAAVRVQGHMNAALELATGGPQE